MRFVESVPMLKIVMLLVACLPSDSISAQAPSPGHWELEFSVLDADLSPDDQLVAVTTGSPEHPKHGEAVSESAALWDYRQNRKVAEAHVGSFSSGAQPGPVRFTSDGALLVAADARTIHVFDPTTLKLLRDIEPPLTTEFLIREIETSPISHVAVIAVDESFHGWLFVYDLDTGREVAQRLRTVGVTSISWKPDGTEFAVAMSWGGVDVFRFGSRGQVAATLRGRDLMSVAFSNDRLYGVQTSVRKGSVFNRHLGIDVFDSQGRHKKKLFLPRKDIHDSVAYSNGKLLADTGTVKARFDALDMQTFAGASDAQITVWNSDTRSVIYTSDSLKIRPSSHRSFVEMRLSRTGKMAIVVDRYVRLFQLP
jgi:WD40 repeat protein